MPRALLASLLALLFLSPTGLAAFSPFPFQDNDDPHGAEEYAFSRQNLEGPDERAGSLAALALIQATAAKGPGMEKWRRRHQEFVAEQLHPGRFSGASENALSPESPAPRRIVEAIATYIGSNGAPFQESSDLVLNLLGRGPLPLRDAVVEALVAFIEWEELQPREAVRTKEAVAARILHNQPPGEVELADASRVLWKTDGKRLLEAVMAAIEQNGDDYPSSTSLYLSEVRDRLRIDFTTSDEWREWWSEQKKKSLAEILTDSQRQVGEEAARHWRRVLRRLRETADAPGVLESILETLREARTPELRLAAVSALGDYAEWVRGVKLDTGTETSSRDALLRRAFQALLNVIEGNLQPNERSRVRRMALVAVQAYKAFLERSPDLVDPVSELILERFHAARRGGAYLQSGEQRHLLLEILRVAGTLSLSATREPIEDFLRGLEEWEKRDLELLSTSVVALGRLGKGQLDLETANLFVGLFSTPADPSQEDLRRELRRACVVALNARPAEPGVADLVRHFYLRVVGDGVEDLRIPAILGLGTLAQGMDRGALEALVDIVANPSAYRSQEVVTAIDAIAYVGGKEALETFVPLLGLREKIQQNDRSVYTHLWRKVVGLVKVEGPSALPAVLEQLVERAVREDQLLYLESALELCREPELRPFLSSQEVDLGDPAALHALWAASLVRTKVFELIGSADDADLPVESLLDLQEKDPDVREKIPSDVEALERYLEDRAQREKLAETLADSGMLEPAVVLRELRALVDEKTPRDERWFLLRWIEEQLSDENLTSTQSGTRVLTAWLDFVSSEGGAAMFRGLPRSFRTRHVERLQSNRAAETKEPATSASETLQRRGLRSF